MLKLSVVASFMHTMNPCEFRPYYAEDCTECMNKFCKQHKTTREEYRRKKEHLITLSAKVRSLQTEILAHVRAAAREAIEKRRPVEFFEVGWRAEQLVNLEKEIELS